MNTTTLNDPSIFAPAFQRRDRLAPIKDPCDYVMRYGGEAFKALVASSKHVVDYKFDLLVVECLRADPNAHAAAIEKSVAWFATYIHARSDLEPDHPSLMTPIKRGAIFCRLAQMSGLTVAEVRAIIEHRLKGMPSHTVAHPKHVGFPRSADSEEKSERFLEDLDRADAESGGEV